MIYVLGETVEIYVWDGQKENIEEKRFKLRNLSTLMVSEG